MFADLEGQQFNNDIKGNTKEKTSNNSGYLRVEIHKLPHTLFEKSWSFMPRKIKIVLKQSFISIDK